MFQGLDDLYRAFAKKHNAILQSNKSINPVTQTGQAIRATLKDRVTQNKALKQKFAVDANGKEKAPSDFELAASMFYNKEGNLRKKRVLGAGGLGIAGGIWAFSD